MGVVVAQDARAVCGDLFVQGDGFFEAAHRIVGVCEIIACAECEGVVFAQNARGLWRPAHTVG